MRFLLLALIFLQPAAAAQANEACVLQALRRLSTPDRDSSVELEMVLDKQVVKLLTTRDGTASALLKRGELESANFRRMPSKLRSILKLRRWDDLSPDVQIELLKTITKLRKQTFAKDRTIYGLAPRKVVELIFSKPTMFLGKKYEKGTHKVDLSGILRGPVEYHSARDLENLEGVELHFRARRLPSEVSEDARTFQKGSDIPVSYQHVHTVADLRTAELKANPRFEAGYSGDFVRRTNLASEMIDIVERYGSIENTEIGRLKIFGSLSSQHINQITGYFKAVGEGKAKPIGDQFKFGWVGFRGSDKYDAPGLWGLEFRAIPEDGHSKIEGAFMDAVQYGMTTGEMGLPRETFRAWLEAQPKVFKVEDLVSDSWYNQPWNQVLQRAPSRVSEVMSPMQFQTRMKEISPDGNTHLEVKMLFHDWSEDPILFGKEKIKQKVLDWQVRAVKELQRGTNRRVDEIVADFVKYSGLYDEVLGSVGVQVKK